MSPDNNVVLLHSPKGVPRSASSIFPLQTYIDVVSGPVDAADGHAQAAQAALVHVTGNGAAEAHVAAQAVAA